MALKGRHIAFTTMDRKVPHRAGGPIVPVNFTVEIVNFRSPQCPTRAACNNCVAMTPEEQHAHDWLVERGYAGLLTYPMIRGLTLESLCQIMVEYRKAIMTHNPSDGIS